MHPPYLVRTYSGWEATWHPIFQFSAHSPGACCFLPPCWFFREKRKRTLLKNCNVWRVRHSNAGSSGLYMTCCLFLFAAATLGDYVDMRQVGARKRWLFDHGSQVIPMFPSTPPPPVGPSQGNASLTRFWPLLFQMVDSDCLFLASFPNSNVVCSVSSCHRFTFIPWCVFFYLQQCNLSE